MDDESKTAKASRTQDVRTLRAIIAFLSGACVLLLAFPRCGGLGKTQVGVSYQLGGTPLEAPGLRQAAEEPVARVEEPQESDEAAVEEEEEERPESSASNIPVIDTDTQVFMGHKSTNTGWIVDTRCFVNHDKPLIGYGVGCGEDISWDVGMATRYGFQMFLFDPTPKSIKYVKPIQKRHADKITFTPEGLAAKEGVLTFTKPQQSNHVSMRAGVHTVRPERTISLKVNTLKNWMEKFGHTYLDVFKIDIEGSEYEVLEAMIEEGWFPFTQLLIEYHQRWFDKGHADPRHQAVLQGLKDAGFVPYAKRHGNQEISYIKVRDLPYCMDGKAKRSPFV